MNWFFLTLFYSGLVPKAPGTAGSIVALPFGVLILAYFGPQTLFLAALLLTLAGVKAVNKYQERSKTHDDSRIVIDELVGMWLALSIAPGIFTPLNELTVLDNGMLIQIVLSFILFRYFDIKKPSIIGRIDREAPGGYGVMFDDVLAGIAAGIVTAIIWQGILISGLIAYL
ncbi:MAG: phosphatidylglycerophosphatase A [Helicobacteraceae bacterium]|jgi:phosphatidylglycerophosphatase A|nr:phosphatidylglycerophosphatase A [Helicobacteraceae bacterium]